MITKVQRRTNNPCEFVLLSPYERSLHALVRIKTAKAAYRHNFDQLRNLRSELEQLESEVRLDKRSNATCQQTSSKVDARSDEPCKLPLLEVRVNELLFSTVLAPVGEAKRPSIV
jgi:hypothetical protein